MTFLFPGIVLCVCVTVLMSASGNIEGLSLPTAFVFPSIVAALLTLLTCFEIFRSARIDDRAQVQSLDFLKPLLLVATMAFYVVMLPIAGFPISASFLVIATSVVSGGRRILPMIVFTALIVTASYLGFSWLADVPLPTGSVSKLFGN